MWGAGRKVFNCVDLHCGGEPARVLLSGCPPVHGETMREKREYFIKHLDSIRQVLLTEPRGYPCQNLNILLPSNNPEAEIGYIILEQDGIYPLFSGHNTICVVTAVLEHGLVQMKEPETNLTLEAPGGLIKVRAECENGRVTRVHMVGMPSFVEKRDLWLDIPAIGKISVDIAFGGMWYVIVDVEQLGLDIAPDFGKKLAQIGEIIKVVARAAYPVDHPTISYPGPDILVFTKNQMKVGNIVRGKNTVVMSAGSSSTSNTASSALISGLKVESPPAMLDRSACGSGTASVMALLFQKGVLTENDKFVHSSILGTEMEGRVLSTTKIDGNRNGIIPEISGRAFVTAISQQIIEKDDPLPSGFTVSDIWH